MPDSVIERLASGVTVITATRRLARELRGQFDQHQLAGGKTAWESADVLPYDAFLKRAWQSLSAGLDDCPVLLNQWQLAAAWEDIIGDDIRARERDDEPLWNTHASARSAVDAWQTVHAWNIGLDACAQSSHRDHQCWLRWARKFQQLCVERNWIDPYRLADLLCELIATSPGHLPAKIDFCGFDHLLPQQQSLSDALTNAGVDVTHAAAGKSVNQTSETRVFENETDQWLNAAQWARDKLLDNPQAQIAIVAPNLGKSAPAIEYALQQILCPQQLLEPESDAPPYHISLGKKLTAYPVANAALVALRAIAGAPLPLASVSELILSPFIRGADTEAIARCKLEAWCRRYLPYQIRFKQLVKELTEREGDTHCPLLCKALSGALALLENSQPKPASHWAQRFNEWLDQLGWHGERTLDSDEFQAARALRSELQNLTTLDLAASPMRAAGALSWLQRRVAEQPFQVEARGAPVQALGVFEAAGQRFDAVWFGDLLETDWPPAQRPNPFIDIRLQREVGVFAASLEGNHARAEALQKRLIASGVEVVLSRPLRVDEDVETEASPLFDDDARVVDQWDAFTNIPANTPAKIVHQHKPEAEQFIDTRGPALAPEKGIAAGGIAVIENQAKCPFRAFALHRLGARDIETNEQGLAAGERGSLIHRALQLVWEQIESSEKLHALADDELQTIIRDAAERAGKRYLVSSGCGARFQQTQTQWAVDVLSEWFEVEKRRADAFVVSGREEETRLQLGELELKTKIDRIDRMENGHLMLIDYKTGATESLTNWAGARPQSPQLPLYAIAQNELVETVVYGYVKKGNCGFSGVTRVAEFDATDKSPNQVGAVEKNRSLQQDFDGWDALLEHWHTVLPQLAAEFAAGEARVDPLTPAVCARCDLHGLCRVEAGIEKQR